MISRGSRRWRRRSRPRAPWCSRRSTRRRRSRRRRRRRAADGRHQGQGHQGLVQRALVRIPAHPVPGSGRRPASNATRGGGGMLGCSPMKFACLVLAVGLTGAGCSKRQSEVDKPAGLPASGAPAAAATSANPATPPPAPGRRRDRAGRPRLPRTPSAAPSPCPAAPQGAGQDGHRVHHRPPGRRPARAGLDAAVQKHPVGRVPHALHPQRPRLDDAGHALRGRIDITVRIDKDGDGLTRKKGDLHGQANDITVAPRTWPSRSTRVQTEDQTLPGVPAVAGRAGGRPPGTPPGHP